MSVPYRAPAGVAPASQIRNATIAGGLQTGLGRSFSSQKGVSEKPRWQDLLFVITQAKPNATITAQSVAALSEHGRVAQSFIADRVPCAIHPVMTGGRTAQELLPKGQLPPNSQAYGET